MSYKIDGLTPATRAADVAATVAASRTGGARNEPISAAAEPDRLSLTGDAEGLKAMGRELGAAPAGIDMGRVNALKAAIADGSYKIDAQAIASRMLDLDRELGR
ncbi:anti-sigma-28 factor, FlgM family [Pseudoxanthomonas sp. GM95]|uniref:flagellar biosynthesis anti-sigma factor FlgM n=1 Tax=Pseudoxanthomonas sp. GM95 TaxID=1881043 RepID=UPI0008C1944D|nr:flagellar biosynthesis anti-sigma factor FlgM [Pseudoxanthomonas sp. GM95]SEK51956.1 anti-sigma-28 factor, FlgM family [Pseudoxanthomonas sp. GM95]